MTIPNIDLNMILSDQLFLVGVVLVIVGPLVFLFSLIKFIRSKGKVDFVVPHQPVEEEVPSQPTETHRNGEQEEEKVEESPVSAAQDEPVPEAILDPEISPLFRTARSQDPDKTVVMPPFVSDLQAAMEIAIGQVKQLNRKVSDLEEEIERLKKNRQTDLQPNELKEPPMDAADFTKKLLKVVEHVIVLEKEVSNLRGRPAVGPASPTATPSTATPAAASPQFEFGTSPPGATRPPILPL